MSPTMDNIYAARILIKILSRIGFWQSKKSPNWLLYWLPLFVLVISLTLCFITLMWIAVFKAKTLEEAGEVVYMSLTETALLVKIINICYLQAQAQRYINEISTNPAYALHSPIECEVWMREQRKFRRSAIFYILLGLSVCLSSFVAALLSTEYVLPFPVWLPFEWRCPSRYWYAYIYDTISILLTCINNSTLDMTYCYFLFHLSMLYKLIALRFAALHDRPPATIPKELRDIFKLHCSICTLKEKCEELISAPVLCQIILSAVVISFIGYSFQNMDAAKNLSECMAAGQFLTAMTLQIFMPCYYANEVTVNSDHLTTTVYFTEWFDYSPSTRKLIIIYMELFKRPVRIRAGNFFEIGLPIFTKTMNNAYSFFAILLNMSESD